MFMRLLSGLMISAVTVMAFSSVGCKEPAKSDDKKQAKNKNDGKKDLPKGDTHEDWWCQEHGVPEELCSLCLPKAEVKKKFKDASPPDWCEKHKRAESQCFKCDPSKYKKFEDRYIAKYGKAPERPPESEFKN